MGLAQLLKTTIRYEGAPSVLVTAKEVVVPRIYEKLNVTHYEEAKTMRRDLLLSEIPKHEGLYCLLRDKIDKELLDLGKKLKVVSTMSVGYDHIDLEECKRRNIVVTITPDVLTETTAETTVALLLATARRIPEGVMEAKTGGWGTWSPFYMCGVGIRQSTVGIIGFGRIGQSVASKLKAFHPDQIIFNDLYPNMEKAKELGCKSVSIDELYRKSDFIIITCLATPQNKGMINKDAFSKMKSNVVLVNTSSISQLGYMSVSIIIRYRGTLINQPDLITALSNGTIRAAGLDVTVPEPLPLDSPLLKLKNCVVLPHIGSATMQTRKDMMELAEDGILAVLAGGKMPPRIRVA
ncbi:hypothetical protein AB6A40_006124 [Gnathostoma spinigerum]|uniref:Glyoxylate reductase/hydroxypyruvate reductase n=1 Tax=Gnathostoma spinigerum TaxID=75299 RepID=A0ABD6EHF6_9BILA